MTAEDALRRLIAAVERAKTHLLVNDARAAYDMRRRRRGRPCRRMCTRSRSLRGRASVYHP